MSIKKQHPQLITKNHGFHFRIIEIHVNTKGEKNIQRYKCYLWSPCLAFYCSVRRHTWYFLFWAVIYLLLCCLSGRQMEVYSITLRNSGKGCQKLITLSTRELRWEPEREEAARTSCEEDVCKICKCQHNCSYMYKPSSKYAGRVSGRDWCAVLPRF